MRLLVDTDIFCKLASIGLFEAAVRILGGSPNTVERLPALPQMLRRGRLRKELGEALADKLLRVADSLLEVPQPPPEVAAILASRPAVDPGEVQLIAVATEGSVLLMTGDKRALKSVAGESMIVGKLVGRVVCLEAILLALCMQLGEATVRKAVESRFAADKVFSICFSTGNSSPCECLKSYLKSLQDEVKPLVLWAPEGVAQ